MRDLKADLNYVTVPVGIIKIKELYAIAEHALNRAITAEAEVERLQKVYAITNESWKKQVEELAKLRKVADAARGVFLGEGEYFCSEFKNDIDRLRQALAELDKEES